MRLSEKECTILLLFIMFSINPARCVSGSTLLHTASFFGAIPVIKVLSVTEWLPTQMLSQLRLSALSTKKKHVSLFLYRAKKNGPTFLLFLQT